MIFFIFSPVIIYPLWTSKFGPRQAVLSHLWWFLLVTVSLMINYDFITGYEKWAKWQRDYNLPDFSFAPYGNRNQCYLVGLMTGYLLHITKDKEVRMNRLVNLLVWIVVALVAFALIYAPNDPATWKWFDPIYDINKTRAYYSVNHLAWGLVLGWITFSCCRGYGGLINDFLSWDFFLPISKVSFMTYFFHMSFNWYYFYMQDYNLDYSMWLLTQIFVAQVNFFFLHVSVIYLQVMVCLTVGLLSAVSLELPFGKLQKLVLQKIFLGKQ